MKKRTSILSYRMRTSIAMALFAIVPFLIMVVGLMAESEPRLAQSVLSQHVQMLEVYSGQLSRGFQETESKVLYIKNNTNIRNKLSRVSTMTMPEKLQFVAELRETESAINVDNDGLTLRFYCDYSDYNYGGYCYTKQELADIYGENKQDLERILHMGTNETVTLVRGPEEGMGGYTVSVYTKIDNLSEPEHILEITMSIRSMVYPAAVELPGEHFIGACFAQEEGAQAVVLLDGAAEAQAYLEEYYQTGSCKGYYPLEVGISTQPEGKVICLLQQSYVMKLFWDSRVPLIVLVLALIVLVLICSYVTSRMLTNKVIQCITHIDDELGREPSERNTDNESGEDLSGIAQRVRALVDRSREQGQQLEAHKLEKKRMELELLQMRFNPHFLYNTLGSIRYQVKDKRIIRSIDSLIAYYRIVLSKGSLVISVESEIQMIQEYLNLQTFAYDLKSISYVFEIDEEVKRCAIIKHLLQPIVENALEHGVGGTNENATVTIRARLEGENVVFEVEDTGVGMTPEQIVQVTSAPSSSLQVGGYGVYNVIQRIKTYYGPEYGVSYISEPGKGTLARITIPQRSISELTQA